jgi:hypothetical protein
MEAEERLENGGQSGDSSPLLPSPSIDFDKNQFFTLKFLLLVSGLKSTSFAFPCVFSLSLMALILFLGYIYRCLDKKHIDWSMLCHLVFTIHGAAVYFFITLKMSQQFDIFSVIRQLKQPLRLSFHGKCERNISVVTTGSTPADCTGPLPPMNEPETISAILNLEVISQITSLFVLVTALLNFMAVWIEVGNPVALVLGLPHSDGLKFLSLLFWYFYSFGWFLPIAIVCPPVIALLKQILQYEKYVAEHLSELCDIDLLMHWYNELYDLNTLLQNAFGSLVTLTIVVGGVFQIIITMVWSPRLLPLCLSLSVSPLS